MPYCGRPLGEHHGPEIEAAAWETPEPTEPAADHAQAWDAQRLGDDPEPTLACWLAKDIDKYQEPGREWVGDIHGLPAGSDRR